MINVYTRPLNLLRYVAGALEAGMESNPYKVTKSDEELQGSVMRSIFAVAFGGIVVDYLGSHAALIPILLLATERLGSLDAAQAWSTSDQASLIFKFVGVCCSAVGAYFAATVARRGFLIHSLLSALIGIVVGMPSWVARGLNKDIGSWIQIAVCILAAITVGILLERSRSPKRATSGQHAGGDITSDCTGACLHV